MQAAKLAVGLAKISEATLTIVYVMDIHRLAQLPGYAAMPGLKDNLIEFMLKEGNEATSEIGDLAQDAG